MNSTKERNSDNAAQATQVVQKAARSAQQGSDVVTNVVSRMYEIPLSSQQA
ncbi:hypothetical protein R5M92_11275 [Halomonas sp. Bachu 37]|uniref:hypothetical protein n=1 Tax=Halomonas kashgarensis TaxID=3084920 RepID=UPI0032174E73